MDVVIDTLKLDVVRPGGHITKVGWGPNSKKITKAFEYYLRLRQGKWNALVHW